MNVAQVDMATNVWAHRNRTKKVEAMIGQIDRLARMSGVNPHSTFGIEVIRNMLANWSEKHWMQCALDVGSRRPSDATRRLVADIYRRRSEGAK